MKAKNGIFLFAIIVVSALLTLISSAFRYEEKMNLKIAMTHSMFNQEIVETLNEPRKIDVLYYKNTLIGVVNDDQKLQNMLDEVYEDRYQSQYPNTELGLSTDIHYAKEYSLELYEDKDEEILEYINKEDLFSVETHQITFDNGSILFVRDLEEYKQANKEYIQNFVDEASYSNIINKKENSMKQEYDSVVVNFAFDEHAQISKGYAAKSEILNTKDEIVNWFIEGYDKTKVIYTVEDGDTVQGVASKSGLEVSNLMAINKDKLKEENQLLEPGMKLNVKGIQSPVNLRVEKEAINKVTVYPESPQYIEDATLAMGVEKIVQEEKLGYRKVSMKEVYKNGILVDSKELSTQNVEVPQRKIVRVGSKQSNDGNSIGGGEIISVGNFRYPVDNPSLTCGWMCYSGHEAMDVKNYYNQYGDVIAADGGIVSVNSYHPVNGYWMEIDHQNGFVTYYGHMNEPGYIGVGEKVEKGQVIGQIGMTGVATGPHVHFEIRFHGVKMDPAMYLQ